MPTQKFKVNEVDIDLINQAAQIVGMTVAAFIRQAAMIEALRVVVNTVKGWDAAVDRKRRSSR